MKYLALALLTCALSGTLAGGAQAQMMGQAPPVPMTPAQFSQTPVGQSVQIAVRIARVNRATLYGELLQHQTDTTAHTTGKHLTLYFADGTPVVMGTARDIAPGAVLFVYGILTKPGQVDIKRAVIDTKFVTVQ
jgi:hypothetical protein